MSQQLPPPRELRIPVKDLSVDLLPVSVDLPLLLLLLLNALYLVLLLNTNIPMSTRPVQPALEPETLAIPVSLLTRKPVPLETMFPNTTPIVLPLLNPRLVDTLCIAAAIRSILPVIMLPAARTTLNTTPLLPTINNLPRLNSNPAALAIIPPTAIIKAT